MMNAMPQPFYESLLFEEPAELVTNNTGFKCSTWDVWMGGLSDRAVLVNLAEKPRARAPMASNELNPQLYIEGLVYSIQEQST
jgi:hypothetical protein